MGAWEYGTYKRGQDGRQDERLGAAIIAIKQELRFTGYARSAMVGDLPFFGDAVASSVRDFQAARGLKADGEVGSVTAKELFRKRIELAEDDFDLPRGTLGKTFALESMFDPVAVGYADAADRGIAQINTDTHDVSFAEAYNPAFAIPWAGAYVSGQKDEVERRLNTLKAARAAYNVGPYYACEWLKDDFPVQGREVDGTDWYRRATEYIANIDKQSF